MWYPNTRDLTRVVVEAAFWIGSCMFAPLGTADMVTVVFVNKIGQMTNKQMLNRYQYMNTILMITTITKIIIRSDVARSADTRKTLFAAETARPCLPTAHPAVQYLSSNKSYRPIFVIQQILPPNICHLTNPPVQYLSSSISRCPIILIKFVLSNVSHPIISMSNNLLHNLSFSSNTTQCSIIHIEFVLSDANISESPKNLF